MRLALRASSVCWVALLAFVQTPSLPEGAWRIPDAPEELHGPISRADLIIVAMQDGLRRELTAALEQGGPAFAINACHVDVEGIARRMGRTANVSAGRTSDRLRSPANAPRPWAAPLVTAHAGLLARDVPGFAVDLGSAVGVLRPIAHRPLCASCHGRSDRLDPAVRVVLRERYPKDRAIGFRDGEIRGWFWVQVPKQVR